MAWSIREREFYLTAVADIITFVPGTPNSIYFGSSRRCKIFEITTTALSFAESRSAPWGIEKFPKIRFLASATALVVVRENIQGHSNYTLEGTKLEPWVNHIGKFFALSRRHTSRNVMQTVSRCNGTVRIWSNRWNGMLVISSAPRVLLDSRPRHISNIPVRAL